MALREFTLSETSVAELRGDTVNVSGIERHAPYWALFPTSMRLSFGYGLRETLVAGSTHYNATESVCRCVDRAVSNAKRHSDWRAWGGFHLAHNSIGQGE